MQHLDDYVCLIEPSKAIKENLIENPTDPNFQKIMKFFDLLQSSLAYQQRIADDDPSKKLLLRCKESFDNKLDRLTIIDKTTRSSHPNLPVAIYFPKEHSAIKTLRVLLDGENHAVNAKFIKPRFYSLIKLIHILHKKLLKKWKFDEEYNELIENGFFTWLLEEIYEPKSSLPVQGFVKIAGDYIAPWDLANIGDDEDQPQILFGNVQLVLIKFFSVKQTIQSLSYTAKFLIASWYQCNPPNIQSKYFKNIHKFFGPLPGSPIAKNLGKIPLKP
ncbi:hypothetical protein PGTUg99_006922 [Puccinia graminis f. sp. tritici]|uniref:Uncharacterized protein n=1 Tax=Puccinia graminis f. sp. tritici TaxID=56615 RepID=A0A5B0RUZ1_PUCGR|nr:hypothetical protein PGTUg99_006922 [Puccinia graminis f. sp. tritici]